MKLLRIAVVGAVPALAFTIDAPSSSRGLYFPSVTQTLPACGACHRSSPGADTGFPQIRIAVAPATRILARNQSIAMAVTTTGGQTVVSRGGFAMDATAGTFSNGANTALAQGGQAITHSDSLGRTWTFGYNAPNTAGLVELATVSNTVNGDSTAGDEDMWAFHGFDDQAAQVTPVRLYVNADGVVGLGSGCAGAFGNVPVLGSSTAPTVGNANFALELFGAAPSTTAGVVLGVTAFNPGLDLTGVGITGCSLYVDPLVFLFGATSAGDAQRGEGSATFPLPIPAQPELVGGVLHLQGFILDPQSGRANPLTFTNGLTATLQ
jgi:hypothetical protein